MSNIIYVKCQFILFILHYHSRQSSYRYKGYTFFIILPREAGQCAKMADGCLTITYLKSVAGCETTYNCFALYFLIIIFFIIIPKIDNLFGRHKLLQIKFIENTFKNYKLYSIKYNLYFKLLIQSFESKCYSLLNNLLCNSSYKIV